MDKFTEENKIAWEYIHNLKLLMKMILIRHWKEKEHITATQIAWIMNFIKHVIGVVTYWDYSKKRDILILRVY